MTQASTQVEANLQLLESINIKLEEMLKHYSRQDESFSEYLDSQQTANLLLEMFNQKQATHQKELLDKVDQAFNETVARDEEHTYGFYEVLEKLLEKETL